MDKNEVKQTHHLELCKCCHKIKYEKVEIRWFNGMDKDLDKIKDGDVYIAVNEECEC